MSPLTKAFVVLTTLLSIVMVSMTVAVIARTENHREMYLTMKADRNLAMKAKARYEGELANRAAQEVETNSVALSEVSLVRAQFADKEGEVRSRDESIARLGLESSRMTAAHLALSGTLESANIRLSGQDARILALSEELGEIGREKSEAESALVNAIAARNRYEAEVRLLTQRLRAEETERAELENENDVMRTVLEGRGQDPDDVIEAGQDIRIAGSIVGVDQITDGLTLVELNVGTRDGVRSDMEFTVSRGDQYLGTVRITRVDTDRSVGEVTLQVNPIRTEDSAKTGD